MKRLSIIETALTWTEHFKRLRSRVSRNDQYLARFQRPLKKRLDKSPCGLKFQRLYLHGKISLQVQGALSGNGREHVPRPRPN